MNTMFTDTAKIVGESDKAESPDNPFGWIEMVPSNPVTVVVRKCVMVVVVTFSKGEDGDNVVIYCSDFF